MIKSSQKILFVNSGIDPTNGGIQRVSYEIIEALKSVSADLSILDCSFGNSIANIIKFRKNVSFNYYCILFSHIDLAKLLIFGPAKCKIIIFLHGIECWKKLSIVQKYALKFCDLLICNSNYTWEKFIKYNPDLKSFPHRIVYLGIGIFVPYKPPPVSPLVALIIGRMSKLEDYKGHKELINIWPSVLKRLPKAQLWIVGDGDLRYDLEDLANGCSCIKFWGKISESKKENLLHACTCFLMPSQNEGFGLVYLEAMRLGRPCLVSTFDAGQEIISPPFAGISVNPFLSADLLSAVIRLLDPNFFTLEHKNEIVKKYSNNFTAFAFHLRLISALFN